MTSIITQIETLEQSISEYEKQLEKIERNLRLESHTDERRCILEKKQTKVKEQISEAYKELRGLRKENGKSFMIAAIVVIVLGVAYWYTYVLT